MEKFTENAVACRAVVKSAIRSLLCRGYIRKDSRDRVDWDHDEATFYTEPSRREEIDSSID